MSVKLRCHWEKEFFFFSLIGIPVCNCLLESFCLVINVDKGDIKLLEIEGPVVSSVVKNPKMRVRG